MKKFIAYMLAIICCTLSIFYVSAATDKKVAPLSINNEISLRVMPRPLNDTEDKEELTELIDDCDKRMDNSHEMADNARELGYQESCGIIQVAKKEWHIADWQKNYYTNVYKENGYNKFDKQSKEYPIATEIWCYLKDYGYNDYVTAGIMGNIMAEVGGQTLNILPCLGNKGFYGMCQWSLKYYPEVKGLSLPEQCKVLTDSIKYQIDTYGFCYKKGFKYENFIEMTNEKDAALAFAKTYERCNSGSYYVRQKNATVAYNYFCD